ncbi:hypothetical protein Aca07nite_57750 [Actinoplanes capillaceus]|uniref:Protein kinase domain-containing protein n=1 Tax=Actinoplanes campanulatus TaxID=113559 RepID=A0ABQ3WQF1_9ACTN|nr:hypothetical protein [Actinoplanes capillaceus]GID48500.1 hypothetical protein Aca07nite_57750 [Actinoplanes capillaceus]
MTEPETVAKGVLGRLDHLGKGGTAVIYRLPGFQLPGHPPLVYKEYKDRTRAIAGPALKRGLLDLVRRRLAMTDQQRAAWDRLVTWPLRVVVDGDEACGILLPLIPAAYFQDLHTRSGQRRRVPREVDMLFGDTKDMARIGLSATSADQRRAVAVQIARVCALTHHRNVVLGDISGRNMVYDVSGPRPQVMIIDADAARVEGSRGAFGGQPQTPHWEPPEALLAASQLRAARKRGDQKSINTLLPRTTVQNRATDVYKLALMLVRVVDHGRGKAVNRKPDAALRIFRRAWGKPAAELLERAMGAAPDDRPTARELYESMRPGGPPAPKPQPKPQSPQHPPVPKPRPPDPPKTGTGPIENGKRAGSFVFVEGRGWVRDGR